MSEFAKANSYANHNAAMCCYQSSDWSHSTHHKYYVQGMERYFNEHIEPRESTGDQRQGTETSQGNAIRQR